MRTTQSPGEHRHTGGCACGAVRYSVSGPLRPVIACHCQTCRRASGHYMAATRAPRERVAITGGANVTWYRASDHAARGFCATCGSHLFFAPTDGAQLSLFAGGLDAPTGLGLAGHIHVAEQGDYYRIADELPRRSAGGAADILAHAGGRGPA